jgi:hypothetical protein
MSIADLDVLTELDGPQAADRLVADLAQGTSCEARQPLLVRMGVPLAKVAAAIPQRRPWPRTRVPGRSAGCARRRGSNAFRGHGRALVAAIDHATAEEEDHPQVAARPGGRTRRTIAALLADDKRGDEDRTGQRACSRP